VHFEKVSRERVVQQVQPGCTVELEKTVLRLTSTPPLALVRKTLPEGPTKAPVVLVHGFAQNRYSWHNSVRSLSAYLAAEGFDTYNLELRGHGRSRAFGAFGARCFPDYVQDLVAVAEALGEPAFFVGHSLGGAVIYASATRVPMRGVVGIGACFGFGRGNPLMRTVCAITESIAPFVPIGALNIDTRFIGGLLAKAFMVVDSAAFFVPFSGWAPGSVEPELVEERLRMGFDWTSLHIWFEMARWSTAGQFPHVEDWQQTDVPVYVMAGDLDHLLPPEDARLAFDNAGSGDKTYELFDDYRHEVHWGHLDLILGKRAPDHTWPAMAQWMAVR
jgi:alpha-beta hydrolase superfamily lysophospholipase